MITNTSRGVSEPSFGRNASCECSIQFAPLGNRPLTQRAGATNCDLLQMRTTRCHHDSWPFSGATRYNVLQLTNTDDNCHMHSCHRLLLRDTLNQDCIVSGENRRTAKSNWSAFAVAGSGKQLYWPGSVCAHKGTSPKTLSLDLSSAQKAPRWSGTPSHLGARASQSGRPKKKKTRVLVFTNKNRCLNNPNKCAQ